MNDIAKIKENNMNVIQALMKLQPLARFPLQCQRIKNKEKFDQLFQEALKNHRKTYSFLDKPLPNYSRSELDKILSKEEKEFAEKSEYSGLGEAAESYHKK
jgi:hypothetical protein